MQFRLVHSWHMEKNPEKISNVQKTKLKSNKQDQEEKAEKLIMTNLQLDWCQQCATTTGIVTS